MTKVKYAIINRNDREVTRFDTLYEAQNAVTKLGRRFHYKAVYEDYDPEDTPERREQAREHARKVREAIQRKAYEKELAHAPAYVNISGVGAT